MGIGNIWAKAISEPHGRILEQLGIEHVVYPEHDMGRRVAHLVKGRMLDFIQFEPDYAMVKTAPPALLLGLPLSQTGVRREHGITVVGVKTAGGAFTHATGETVLEARRHGHRLRHAARGRAASATCGDRGSRSCPVRSPRRRLHRSGLTMTQGQGRRVTAMTDPAAIETDGLTKSYGDQAVLRGVDLSVPAGTVLALLGSNGAGKTTAVKILSTLLEADGGRARVSATTSRPAPPGSGSASA